MLISIQCNSQNNEFNSILTESYLNLDSGLSYSKNKLESLKIEAYSLRDTSLMSRSEMLLGLAYKRLGELDSSALHLNLSEIYAIATQDSNKIFTSKTNLMNLYGFNMENPGEALIIGKLIYSDFYQSQSFRKKALFDNALAALYIKLEDFESALEAINRGINCAFEANDSIELQNLNQKLADVALKTGDYTSALSAASQAIKYGYNDCEGILYSLLLKARILSKQKDTKALKKVISEIHDKKSCPQFEDDFLDLHYQLYEVYRNINASDSALKYAILYQTEFQEQVNENTQDAILKYRELYEAEKKEKEIEKLTYDTELSNKQRLIYQIVALLSVIIGIAIAVILFINYKRQRTQVEKLEQEKEVNSLQTMLFAQEEERQRIARDLHDSIGALLSAAKLHITNIEHEIQKLTDLDFLKNTENIIDHASKEVRRVAHDMMPGVLMKLGLEDGLEDFFDKIRGAHNFTVNFVCDEFPHRLSNKEEIMIYRMVQEMVNNTIKHSNASEIKVMIKYNAPQITLIYKDDGVGFEANKLDDKSNIGLSGIKSRASFIHADLKLESSPNHGVSYTISFTPENDN